MPATSAEDVEYQEWKKSKAGKKAPPEGLDAAGLQALIQKMQRQIDDLHRSQGVPVNPIDAAVKTLIAHVEARKAANPQYDFSELEEQLNSLGDNPSAEEAELVRETIADHAERFGQIRHEFGYLTQVGRNLHREILKEQVAAQKSRDEGTVVPDEEEAEVEE